MPPTLRLTGLAGFGGGQPPLGSLGYKAGRQCIIGVYTLMMIGTGAGFAYEFASGLR
jgi:hypothetical protein